MEMDFEKRLKSNLVNTVLLSQKIEQSPYKMSDIAEKIGMSYDTLNRRLNKEGKFHLYEVTGLIWVLGLTTQEIFEIFFYPYVSVLEQQLDHDQM